MSDQNDEALAEPWAKKREDANATPPQHDCDALNIETIESIKYETSNSSDKCEHIEQNGKLELNGVGGKVGVTENGILETDNGILETDNGISEIDNGILETDKGILETNGGEKLDTKDDNKSDSKLGDETSGCDTKEDRKRRISGGELSDISEKLDSVEGVDNEICDVEVKNETVIVMAEEKVAVVTAEDGKPDVEVHIEFSAMEEGNVGVARAVDEKIYHQFYQPAPMRRLEHPVDKSLMLSVIYSLFYLVLVLVVFCPIAATLAVLLPVGWVLRRCAACFCCCAPNRTCACCCSRMLSHTDNVWLHDAVLNQMIAQSVIKLERGLGLNQFREIIKNRLVLAEEKNGRKMYPRFTKRVVPVYSGYAWKTDDEFMIENHVYSMPDNIQTEEELRRHVADMSTKQLPMDHPLWEMQFLTNFGEEGDTVVLFRVHPCVCDGISLVQILYKSLVDNPSIWQLKPRFGQSAFVFNAIRAMLVGPLVFVHKWIVMSNDCNPLHGPQLSGKWTVAWSKPFSFARATRIKQVTRSTLNDVLLAVCAGNLRNYLKAKGVSHPYNMMAAIPVDMRGQGAEILMGAHFGLNDLTLPTNTEGAIPRLWEVRREMDELKNAADPVVLYGSQWVLANALPDRWFRRMWWQIWHKATCFISSLPGPDTVLTFSSHEIKSIIYWMPPGPNVAVSISFLSYADQVRMAVIADKSVLPDPDLLTSDFIDQMEELAQLLANRRIPGEHPHRRMSARQDDSHVKEPTIAELQKKMTQVQVQLQDLKTKLDSGMGEQCSEEEQALVDKVETLKEEFRELLAEIRHKRASQGSGTLSDDLDDEDGELRRMSLRKRSMSMSSRRSIVSAMSSARPLMGGSTSSTRSPSLSSQHSPPSPTHRLSLPSPMKPGVKSRMKM